MGLTVVVRCIASSQSVVPSQYIPRGGVLYWGVKRPVLEAGRSPLSSTEIDNGGTVPPLPNGIVLNYITK